MNASSMSLLWRENRSDTFPSDAQCGHSPKDEVELLKEAAQKEKDLCKKQKIYLWRAASLLDWRNTLRVRGCGFVQRLSLVVPPSSSFFA